MRNALLITQYPPFFSVIISMKMSTKLSLIKLSLIASICLVALSACIEDSVSTNPAHQPEFSVDTLRLGRVFTDESTPTHKFMVYNRHSEVMSISSVGFKNGGTGFFRLNVDGMAGSSFSNVEIRPNDSIYVFVEATLPPNGQNIPVSVNETVEFVTNGVTTSVVLDAQGRDVKRLKAHTILTDTTVTASLPLQIFDSLVVAPGVTLTLAPGAELFFHDGSSLQVHGSLVANGTPEQPVTLGGDRSGWVATNIPYQIMSMQWEGVKFYPSSAANALSHTVIENTVSGVTLDSLSTGNESVPALTLVNCRLRNSGSYALAANHSSVAAVGCEFAEGADGVVLLRGANHNFANCSFANYYLFSHIAGPIITFLHADDASSDLSSLPYLRADFNNCIVAGIGGELSHRDLNDTDIFFRRCLMNVSGTDDLHFVDMLWNVDPLWLTDRPAYFFDYRLQENSPAVGASLHYGASSQNPIAPLSLPLTDFYGTPHPSPASVGAMEKK